ncbi:MAG TPA: hypothetical protein VLD59_04785 [Steroidobacteraceae bacterium]|nr:hypothetical protein [Steroidobacteraceae bacterium]
MTDEQIDAVFNAMPGGALGFCKDWGYRQFARALLDAAGIDVELQRETWRAIVRRATADANRYGLEGLKTKCEPSETGQMLSWHLDQPTKDPNGGRSFDDLLNDLEHCARWERDEVEAAKATLRRMVGADEHDAERFRWLTEDHADPEARAKCRELLGRMGAMSYSAACTDIDSAMAADIKRQMLRVADEFKRDE